MFTGIVQNRGKILKIQQAGHQRRFTIQPLQQKEKLSHGESLSVDGVCLTVSEIKGRQFQVEAIWETLEATTLKYLKPKDCVNLERSLRWGQSFGGHFVTGHVDGTGKIRDIQRKGKNVTMTFSAPPRLIRYVAPRGSVAIDGISLTVHRCWGRHFTVGLVPYTRKVTTLGAKQKGDRVNLEVDLVARYLERLLPVIPVRKSMSLNAFARGKIPLYERGLRGVLHTPAAAQHPSSARGGSAGKLKHLGMTMASLKKQGF